MYQTLECENLILLKFLFVNYCSQIGQDLDEDPRLKAMKREWFEGKDCLDIGCNSGLITITIGKQFFANELASKCNFLQLMRRLEHFSFDLLNIL